MRFMIPGKVRGKERPRKGKYGGLYTPPRTTEYEGWIKDAFTKIAPDHDPYAGPVRVTITAYIGHNKSDKDPGFWSMKKPDIDNIEKIVLDALNGVAYVDDAQVAQSVKSKLVCPYGEDRLEVELGGMTDVGYLETV